MTYITRYNVLCFYLDMFRPMVKTRFSNLLMVGGPPAFRPPSLWASTQRTDLLVSGAKHDEAECQKMFGQNANPLDIPTKHPI